MPRRLHLGAALHPRCDVNCGCSAVFRERAALEGNRVNSVLYAVAGKAGIPRWARRQLGAREDIRKVGVTLKIESNGRGRQRAAVFASGSGFHVAVRRLSCWSLPTAGGRRESSSVLFPAPLRHGRGQDGTSSFPVPFHIPTGNRGSALQTLVLFSCLSVLLNVPREMVRELAGRKDGRNG